MDDEDGSHGDSGDDDTNYQFAASLQIPRGLRSIYTLKISEYYMSSSFLSLVCFGVFLFFFFFNVLNCFESWLLHPRNSLFSSLR